MAFPTLMDQQAAASQFIQTRPYAGVFLDMSGGKSLATLHALTQIGPRGHCTNQNREIVMDLRDRKVGRSCSGALVDRR